MRGSQKPPEAWGFLMLSNEGRPKPSISILKIPPSLTGPGEPAKAVAKLASRPVVSKGLRGPRTRFVPHPERSQKKGPEIPSRFQGVSMGLQVRLRPRRGPTEGSGALRRG